MEAKQTGVPKSPPAVRSARAKFLSGFAFAIAGIAYCVRTQVNFRVHISISIVAIILGVLLGMSWAEWALLATVITLVLAAEMVNTMVESLVDLVTQEYHPLAKIAKDVSAGVVLVTALGAAVAGVLLFLPKLWIWLHL
ncbi:MAG TPA: diacylglycerol kinase family protein [Chloroflexia bacterium]|nr:diacylglycerol kinase family protein [Chloroflexia bacterium]